MGKKVLLMILDGWGIATNKEVSAIDHATTPFIDSLYSKYAHSSLEASGLAVGLPEGQMGNSEVGHMNIGAGRVVYQDLVKINKAVADSSLEENETLMDGLAHAKSHNVNLHLFGLVSDGGVHSHITHLKGLLSLCGKVGLDKVYVHVFTDGRDTDPQSGLGFITELQSHMEKTTGKVASVIGRYYAMDRDNRWERVAVAYKAMVHGEGNHVTDVEKAIAGCYAAGITDEFLNPIIHVDGEGLPVAQIDNGDVAMCFNFRTDRGREITQALTQRNFPEQNMCCLDLYYLTLTNYDDAFTGIHIVYNKDHLHNTLGELLSVAGKLQIRIAETEKYPHVTFFFSGGRETEFENENRLLCDSPKVATYDLQPEMSAACIRDKIITELASGKPDFICLNFANPDMVGHTGVFEAAVKACETVDSCASSVVEVARENGYATIIIADHGNPDIMINDDGTPNTAHTTNLVPCILVDDDYKGSLKDGKLGDIAPTILTIMDLAIPKEMTGEVLLE